MSIPPAPIPPLNFSFSYYIYSAWFLRSNSHCRPIMLTRNGKQVSARYIEHWVLCLHIYFEVSDPNTVMSDPPRLSWYHHTALSEPVHSSFLKLQAIHLSVLTECCILSIPYHSYQPLSQPTLRTIVISRCLNPAYFFLFSDVQCAQLQN